LAALPLVSPEGLFFEMVSVRTSSKVAYFYDVLLMFCSMLSF